MRGKERTGVLSFQRPFYYHFRTKRDDGDFRKNLSILITPVRPGKSRIMLRTQMEGKLPFWLSHGASNRFLNTDTWLHDLEYHARRNTKGLRYVDASSSDLSPALFRKVRFMKYTRCYDSISLVDLLTTFDSLRVFLVVGEIWLRFLSDVWACIRR